MTIGKAYADHFERTGPLGKPPAISRANVETLVARHRREGSQIPHHLSEMVKKFPRMEEEHIYPGAEHGQLFKAEYPQQSGPTCRRCDPGQAVERRSRRTRDPKTHYGTIGSANAVVKDGEMREN
jgi:hypothetical protein